MSKKALKKVFVTTASLALLVPSFSMAGIQGVRTSGSSSGSGRVTPSGSGTVETGKTTPIEDKTKTRDVLAGTECNMDPDASQYYPLDFFKQISRDGSAPSFEIRDGNKIMIKFPAVINVCGKFVPQPYQDPNTKNVTIMVVNDSGKSYGEYIKCLEEKNVLKEGKIDHDTIESKNYSEYPYVTDYDFDKSKDIQTSIKLSFGYPTAFQGKDGYPSVYGTDSSVMLPPSRCMKAEKLAPSITYLNEGRDVLLENIRKECISPGVDGIIKARKSLGNADALKDIADVLKAKLDEAYLIAVKADVERIFVDMTKIEDEINKNKEMDEATAKKLTKKYADLAKELDNKFLNPAIYRLDNLMKRYAEMEEGEAKTKAAEEIKKLNEDIAQFAKRNSTSLVNLYSLMEKYAINDQAKVIEDIRLKSFLYSKVYPSGGSASDSRGKAISFEDANQRQVKGVQNFERTLNDWSDVYLVGQGSMVPIRKTEAERMKAFTAMNNRWNQYQQNEYKQYYQYCGTGMTGGVKNPIQCQTFIQGVEKRRNTELKRRDKDLSFIKTRNDKLTKMGISYNNYQTQEQAKAQRDDDNSPYGSSYSGFETTFEERYPQYEVPSLSGAYNQNNYTIPLNGQERTMGYQQYGGGLQGMQQGPQMYNGVQGQYQYQMPQMAFVQ